MGKIRNVLKRSTVLRGLKSLYVGYFGIRRRKFGFCAPTATIIPPCYITRQNNVYLYEDTKIEHAHILNRNGKFIMKQHSAASVGLHVVTGSHAMVKGRFYRSITEAEKPAGFDKDVVVEEDVWIGMNVTLTAGVTVGRGSTLATGSVVIRDIPPYCVVGGVPAKPLKFKWTIDEILEHEAALYPESERFTREQLEKIFEETKLKGK